MARRTRSLDDLDAGAGSTKKLLGNHCPTGIGGRDCACCGDAPGKARKSTWRYVKRSERQQVRMALREMGAY